jgi:hypothetical protein
MYRLLVKSHASGFKFPFNRRAKSYFSCCAKNDRRRSSMVIENYTLIFVSFLKLSYDRIKIFSNVGLFCWKDFGTRRRFAKTQACHSLSYGCLRTNS